MQDFSTGNLLDYWRLGHAYIVRAYSMRKIWALCYRGPRNGDRDASTPQRAEDLPNSIWAFETRMGLSKLLEKDDTTNNK